MSNHSQANDYSRYFNLKQKVCLVHMSAGRDSLIYESLSGIVTSSGMDTLELQIIHDGVVMLGDGSGITSYKLTSESMGSGIQVLADLIGNLSDNIFKFRLHGTLEMFQRRIVPRVEFSTRIFQLNANSPLTVFRKKWKQAMDLLSSKGVLPGLVLKETNINLSAGGIGLTVESTIRTTPLAMFFIALDDGLPVCTLAESIWEQRTKEGLRCGYRFIHILKSDQERINSCISALLQKSGGTHLDYKRNWVLVDKMVTDTCKPEN